MTDPWTNNFKPAAVDPGPFVACIESIADVKRRDGWLVVPKPEPSIDRPWTRAEIVAALSLWDQGWGSAEIGIKLKRPAPAVYDQIKGRR